MALESNCTVSEYFMELGRQDSTPSCDHFGRHVKWKKVLATKILAKVANWRPTDQQRKLLEKLSTIVQAAASPVFLFSPLAVQKLAMNA